MKIPCLLLLVLVAFAALSGPGRAQDVVILGEVHDNPAHHRVQAERVAALSPAAIVFEMLTPEQAAGVSAETRSDAAALERALGWDDSGWPEFALYYPIFAAAPQAAIYGAGVPRGVARTVMETGPGQVFGPEAALYGLDQPLPPDQQAARENLQMTAHCDALPADILPGMVAIQRLRDATLARAVVRAHAETGGPVAVITGNGHARRDWGIPAILAQVAPTLELHTLGQGEDDQQPEGGFDELLSAPAVTRPDPCLAFQ